MWNDIWPATRQDFRKRRGDENCRNPASCSCGDTERHFNCCPQRRRNDYKRSCDPYSRSWNFLRSESSSPFSSVMSSSTSKDRDSQNTTEFLQNSSFSRSDSSPVPLDHAVTASDLLLGAYDPAKLHPLAELGDKLDYLLLDDDKTNELPGAGTAIPSRGWGDDLCYGTGTMYLSGA